MTSKLKVNLINDSGDNNLITSDGSGSVTLGTAFPAVGKIGQVVQTVSSSKIASTSTSFTDITGCSVSITPTATSSKVLINFVGMFGSGQNNTNNFYQILRGSTVLQEPQGIRIDDITCNRSYTTCLLDSPSSASEVTYKVQFKCEANEVFINRDNSNNQEGFTTFTVSEVLA